MKSSILCLCALLVCVAGQRITTIQLDGVQYFVSRMNPYSPELNYFLAYQYCRSLGLQLASFETKEKVESMTQYLQNAGYSKYDFWTSGNRLGTGMFLWMSTGLPFNATFDYFESDHSSVQNLDPNSNTSPQRTARDSNSGLDKGCVILKAPTLKWAPEDCSSIKDFICEQTRCYYYNYGSIPVSSAQGRPITTSTPYPTITTTALPIYMSTLAATANEKQQAPLLISRNANLAKEVAPTVAATPAVEVKPVPVTEETAATATHEYEEDAAGDEGEENHTESDNSIDEEEAETTQQSEEESESDAMTHDQKIVASVDGTSVEIPVEQKLKQISAEIEKYSATDKDNETGRQSFMTLSDLLKNLRPNDKITPQIDSDYSNTMRVLGETSILHGRKMKNPEINRSLNK